MDEARATAAKMVQHARVFADSAHERLRARFPHWQIHATTAADSPAWAIVMKAQELEADLVVVGSHGYSTLERLILGSVSQTVLTQAPCSVRVARESSTQPGRALRILVGVDGSTEGEMAVRTVAGRVWPPGTDIRIMMVLDPSIYSAITAVPLPVEPSSDTVTDADGDVNDRIKEVLEASVETIRQNASGVTVSSVLKAGDPKRVLIAEAEHWGADCIFIGSRGLNRWERLLLGSVSTAVAARAHCSVEVVRSARQG
jgi:nucleotide-binding universal stress UspA family protein